MMNNEILLLQNGSREKACMIFDMIKKTITDFNKEGIAIYGNIKNKNEGWSVVKIIYQ